MIGQENAWIVDEVGAQSVYNALSIEQLVTLTTYADFRLVGQNMGQNILPRTVVRCLSMSKTTGYTVPCILIGISDAAGIAPDSFHREQSYLQKKFFASILGLERYFLGLTGRVQEMFVLNPAFPLGCLHDKKRETTYRLIDYLR